MTSDPAGQDERHPPTIELKATEVQNPAQEPAQGSGEDMASSSAGDPAGAAETSSSEPPDSTAQHGPGPTEATTPPARGSSTMIFHAMSAIVGAVVAAAIVAGLWIGGIVPPHQGTEPSASASSATAPPDTATSSEVQDLTARVDKLEGAVASEPNQQAATSRIAALEAQTKSLSDSLAALNRRLDGIAGTSNSAAKQAAAAQSAAQAAKTASDQAGQASQAGVQKSDFDALAARVAALESTAKGFAEATSQASGDDRAARLSLAAQALHAAVERGGPYRAELAAVKALGAPQNATASLEPFAASGVASAAALAQELASLVPALQHAVETSTGEASSGATTILERLEANARHLVRITPVTAPAGNTPQAVIARIEADAARADIAAMQSDVAALPVSVKPLAGPWLDKAKARDSALQASRQITADALAALSKPASQ
ncbi:MAG: hypothetical protein WBB34_12640 [Xanthobacteraceae bacterium]